MATYDPLERMNRFTYRFNARFDEAIYLPVANVYRRIPKPIRTGVLTISSPICRKSTAPSITRCNGG